MHKRVPRGMCPVDDGQWPDRLKTDDNQTVQKMMHQSEKICSLQNISCSRYHIMYHFVYIFSGWISRQQDVSRIRTTKMFIIQMCMMNIFVICFLHASCSRLSQPVEVCTNWYMMWYLKKDMFCREHIFFDWCIIFCTVCPPSVFGRSGHRPSSSGHVPCGTHLWILRVLSYTH